jgi:hypothetical protein
MIELISEETVAIKTANASAVKERLRPKGNCLKKIICSPEHIRGSILKERQNEAKTRQKARIFLRRVFKKPTNGNMAEPTIGIRIVRIKIVSGMFIKITHFKLFTPEMG